MANRRKRKRNHGKRPFYDNGGPLLASAKNNTTKKMAAAASPTSSADSFAVWTRVVRAPSLGTSLPPLIITYTNEPSSIHTWLNQHVLDPNVSCLGLDTESKPCFTKDAAKSARGPDTLQLAVPDGHCLVIHLSHMAKNPKRMRCNGTATLMDVLENKKIAKAGVGVDDDALELHKNHFLDISCRLDLRNVEKEWNQKLPAENDPSNGQKAQPLKGLKALAEKIVKGLVLPKQKKLQMSNWAARLSDDQIGYAAADAFAGAVAIATLVADSENEHTQKSLIALTLAGEIGIANLEEDRSRKKQERKRQKEAKRREMRGNPRKKVIESSNTSVATSQERNVEKLTFVSNTKRKDRSQQGGHFQNKKRKTTGELRSLFSIE